MDDEKRTERETGGDADVEDLEVTGDKATEDVRGGAKAEIPAARVPNFSSEPDVGTGRPG